MLQQAWALTRLVAGLRLRVAPLEGPYCRRIWRSRHRLSCRLQRMGSQTQTFRSWTEIYVCLTLASESSPCAVWPAQMIHLLLLEAAAATAAAMPAVAMRVVTGCQTRCWRSVWHLQRHREARQCSSSHFDGQSACSRGRLQRSLAAVPLLLRDGAGAAACLEVATAAARAAAGKAVLPRVVLAAAAAAAAGASASVRRAKTMTRRMTPATRLILTPAAGCRDCLAIATEAVLESEIGAAASWLPCRRRSMQVQSLLMATPLVYHGHMNRKEALQMLLSVGLQGGLPWLWGTRCLAYRPAEPVAPSLKAIHHHHHHQMMMKVWSARARP